MTLIQILQSLKPTHGLEVGVRDGNSSKLFLENLPSLQHFWGIDHKTSPIPHKMMEDGENYTYLVMNSIQASCQFPDQYFDFIYIDGDHRLGAVRKDIEIWWPKIRIGGILCGDDFCEMLNPDEGRYGVVTAVEVFCNRYNLTPNVIGITDENTIDNRKAFAVKIGKICEDACWLANPQKFPAWSRDIALEDRQLTTEVVIPQWWILKNV